MSHLIAVSGYPSLHYQLCNRPDSWVHLKQRAKESVNLEDHECGQNEWAGLYKALRVEIKNAAILLLTFSYHVPP